MREEYDRVLSSLTEEDVQELIARILSRGGWSVKNIHKSDRKHERGADLAAERQGENRLIAVKRRPGKGDIPQLQTLQSRGGEASLSYVYVLDPTEPFREEMNRTRDLVQFIGPSELHGYLIRGESIQYMTEVFSEHQLTHELSDSIAVAWSCRSVRPPHSAPQTEDVQALWKIKDAVLKHRASLCLISLIWEDRLMNETEMDPDNFGNVLDMVLSDLDYVQTFAGGGLFSAFCDVKRTEPHILSQFWSSIRDRTFWIDLAHRAERMDSEEKVARLSRRFWAVPDPKLRMSHSGLIYHDMRGFYSILVGILKTLALAATGMDSGADLALLDGLSKSGESIYK